MLHRTLFGVRAGRERARARRRCAAPRSTFGPEMLELLRQEDDAARPDASGRRALDALLASARDVFVERGYHNTRVDDLVAAAGVSHGAFYRYFRNKEQLARILTAGAVQAVGTAVTEIPDALGARRGRAGDRTASLASPLPRRARRTRPRCCASGSTRRSRIPAIRAESAPLLDWGRRRMSRYLRPRGFGDVDIEAVVMVALLGVFGARPRSAGRGRRRRAHHRARPPRPLTGIRDRSGAPVTTSRLRRDRLLPRRAALPGPVPVLRVRSARTVRSGASRTAASSWSPGIDEAMAVYNDTATFSSCNTVSRAVHDVPGPARGRRHQRDHRGAPRRAAVQRPAADVRSAEAHRAPRPADAADHAEAPQGERGVHVAARRSPDRRVPRPRRVRVRPRLREPVHPARHRRPARRSRGRPRDVPRGAAGRATADPTRKQAGRWRTSRWSSSTSGSRPTSRSAGASRATTS